MNLQELLSGVALTECRAAGDVEITGISYDTRDLKPGALFAALSGYKTDGHRYIREALEKGAAAVLCQRAPDFDGPWLVAGDTRAALADVSANWFGRPAEAMTCVGVTGTNGKTTTTYLLKAALEGALKAKVGLIGTNQNMIGEEILPAHRTTPESYELQALLRQMADAGCTHVVMEVSSHALVLHRVRGIRFAAGIFTNLTQDHLDFHGTMEAYRAAKGRLFEQSDLAVLNLDDEAGRYYARTAPCPVFTYSERKDEADLVAKNIRLFPSHVEFEAVAKGADLAIITTDDPDRDDPAEVIADIATCFGPGSCPHVGIVDRREAVRYALEQLCPGDMLLLCGKGREGYQLVQGKKIPYDEEETVRSCARELLESRPQAL